MKDYPERWINGFLQSASVRECCAAAKISKDKYYKLRADRDFQAALRKRRDLLIESAVEALRESFLRNVRILQEIAEDSNVAAQTRVNAIGIMMSQLHNWMGTTDILARLEALETAKTDNTVTFLGA